MNSSKPTSSTKARKKGNNRPGRNKKKRERNAAINSMRDSRFKTVLQDPRFNEIEKSNENDKSIKLDSRFAEMLSNPAFATDNCM